MTTTPNPYGEGWADGHKGNPFNNPYPADSYRANEYYRGYQDGSVERDVGRLATPTYGQELE